MGNEWSSEKGTTKEIWNNRTSTKNYFAREQVTRIMHLESNIENDKKPSIELKREDEADSLFQEEAFRHSPNYDNSLKQKTVRLNITKRSGINIKIDDQKKSINYSDRLPI